MIAQRHASLLIIDDSPEDRETYKAYLQELEGVGLNFVEAEGAEEGLEICRKVNVDCILLDYHLPTMDGLRFLEIMKSLSDDTGKHPTVVMITGRGSEGIAVAALKRGAADYIVKSQVTRESLHRAVLNALERRRLIERTATAERERRHGEAELREERERLALIMDGARDYAIVMIDEGGVIRQWSQGARMMFRRPAVEAVGFAYRLLHTPEDKEASTPLQDLERARKEGVALLDRAYLRADGSRLYAHGSLRPLSDGLGSPHGFVLVLKETQPSDGDGKGAFSPDLMRELPGLLSTARETLEKVRATRRGLDGKDSAKDGGAAVREALGDCEEILARLTGRD